MHVVVADSSAVVRSVLKEIILKTKKLDWIGEAVTCDELKNIMASQNPNVVIANKSIFDSERTSALGEYCQKSETPSIIFYTPGDKPYYSSKNVKCLEMPAFISFSSEKIAEYAEYLEQQILDIKCNVLLENHPGAVASSINEDGSYIQPLKNVSKDFSGQKFKAVLVGVSTGGPGALLEFLKGVGKGFPLPILITQHIDSFFDKNLIAWLGNESAVPVHLAKDNVKPLAGHVYFAPSDEHLTLISHPEDDFRIILNHDSPVNFLRPSVDKMFESAAKVLGKNCIAVVLTGMGADGAKGCVHLKNLGAYTITQDEASCVIYGMPKAAYEAGGSCEVLSLNQIPERLWGLVGEEGI